MTSGYVIRSAVKADADLLVDFTLREALDAEGVRLDAAVVRRGVTAALDDVRLARYWIATAPTGEIAGSVSTLQEWSNFHGGHYWWVQSLFVAPEHRGRGVVDLLLDHVAGEAAKAGALDLRLYAHTGNERALRVYRRHGFTEAPYVLMRRTTIGDRR
jgi:ribosomal protein S18 acetylase RimI-like enzyme